MAVKVGLEPGGEIHRAIGRRHADVAQVTGAVTCGDVHTATEGDGEQGVIKETDYFSNLKDAIPAHAFLHARWRA